MGVLRVVRVVPRVRMLMGPSTRAGTYPVHPAVGPMQVPSGARCFTRGPFGRDPFTQMEDFMKDMEKKFKRDIEGTVNNIFRDFPRLGASLVPRTTEVPFGHVENISSEHKFKLAFNFTNAKPEDVKVTLKGRNLIVSSKAVVETENSKSAHSVSREYQLPEEVEVEALESSLSHDGVLTVEAPCVPAKASQNIPIDRD